MNKFVTGFLAIIAATQLLGMQAANAVPTGLTAGGNVSGLSTGKSVVLNLRINSTTTYTTTVSANGTYTFSASLATGNTYSASVGIQPSGHICSIANSSGTISSSSITNINVTCVSGYTVGGSLSGLGTGTSVVVRMNSATKIINANGSFTFASLLASGSSYAVSIGVQPANQRCFVTNGTGTISGSNINNVSITCATTYTVSGTAPAAGVSGLGTSKCVTLQLNGVGSKLVCANGSFSFASGLITGENYSVTVLGQPTGQQCTASNNTGTISGANVTNVKVDCVNTYQISVTNAPGASVSISGSTATNATNPNNATSFNFIAKHNDNVSLSATKSGQVCSVSTSPSSLSSIAGNATATVICNAAYTISGSVSGLGSGKTLKLIRTDASSLANTQAGVSVDTGNASFAAIDNPGSEFTAGWGFSVTSNRLLTHLGVWSQGSLYGDVSVGIWDQGGNLLSSVSLLNANLDAYGLDNQFSYAELPGSVMLSAGQQYTLGAFYTGGVLAGFGAPVTPINGLSFASPSLVDFGTSLAMPSLNFSSVYSNGLFGPNLRFLTASAQAAGEEITVNADGSFTFPTAQVDGSTYAVAVSQRPTGQTCAITNASGTIAGANINNVLVTCSNISYTISVANNSGASVSISGSNASNATNPNTALSFNFLAEKDDSVVLSASKTGYSCSITTTPVSINPITGNAIANVNCTAIVYTIGGTNADGASVSISGSSVTGQSATTATPYSFNTNFGDVVTLTATKTGYTCTVAGSPITVGTANVTNANVSCSKNTYTVGGTNADGASVSISGSSITGQSATTANPYSFNAKYGDVVTLTATKTGYTCVVAGSPITVAAANVTNATVGCTINTYTVSGTVTGNTSSVTLTNNGSDSKIVSTGGGGFSFTAQNYNTNYLVATSQPTGQVCVVSNGSGTVTAYVTNVVVTCNNTYTISGSISGLSASGLVLSLSGTQGTGLVAPTSDTASPASGSTSYTFSQPMVSGNTYAVSISTQPAGFNCALANQTGTISTSNVSNVNVTCSSISSSSSSSATGPALNANIILGAPTTSTISMKLFTPDQSGSVSVSYGTATGSYSTTTAPANLVAGTPLQLNISGLTQDTQYFYILNFTSSTGGSSQTSEYTFHTARPVGSAFKFTITADPHLDDKSDIAVYNKTLDNIATQDTDFHIDLGDTFMTEKWYAQFIQSGTGYLQDPATTRDQVQARYKFEMGNFSRIAKKIPLFLVNGNHDAELGWLPSGQASAADLKYWAIEGRSMYFNNPTPNTFYTGEAPSTVLTSVNKTSAYYSWKWGDALFIALDPYWNSTSTTSNDIWNLTLGLTQYQWLQNTLSANAAMKYKFIFLHNLVGGVPEISATSTTGIPDNPCPKNLASGKPCTGGSMRGGIQAAQYAEWGGANYDLTTTGGFGPGGSYKRSTTAGWTMPVHDLLVQYGVTAVFHGHDHLYADETLDGIKYQELPQPSTSYQSNADTNNMNTLAAQGGYPGCISIPATATCKGSSGYLLVTVDPNLGVKSQYMRTYQLPSQGGNNTESASWTVPAPNATSYTIGGHTASGGGLSGLGAGKSITLLNSGVDALVLNANGNFTFATPKLNGSTYNVTVSVQPAGQNCTVSNGSGTVSGANVINIGVTCVDVVTYTIGGNVSGNTGSVTVALSVGGTQVDTKTVNSGGGSFTFAAQNAASNWSVAVTSSPSSQTCTLTNGSGSNLGANVTNVTVSCADTLYALSATTSGLGTGRSIGLSVNSGTATTMTSNITSTLASLSTGTSYTITPVDQTSTGTGAKRCVVRNHKGIISAAAVNTTVVCANAVANTYVVGGSVSGLTGSLGLSLGTQTISLPVGTTGFAFTTPVANGTYTLSVSTQPSGQVCTATTNSVTVSSANNLTTLAVSCVNAYNVGGTVSGLGTGKSVTVLNNGANSQTISTSSAYSFSMVSGSTYNVTVGTQPTDQLCLVMNASGTVGTSDITNISVVCYDYATISVVVSGLANPLTSGSVVVTLNGDTNTANQLTFTTNNAAQSFSTKIPPGNSYAVTIVSNTVVAARACIVTNGVGTTSTSTPTTVTVNVVCKSPPAGSKYYLSGTVSGLTGTGLVITLNNLATTPSPGVTTAENITLVAGSTGFAFSTPVNGTNNVAGNTYPGLITVTTQPTGQLCTVANNGSVNVKNANVTNIAITCSTAYSIGGTVSGLGTGLSLVLTSGTDTLTVSSNGSFTLPTSVSSGTSYNVAVGTQPTNQTCLLSNNSGTVSANVTNIVVSCTTTSFTIGGTISGLGANPVILLNNGGDALTINANGTFTFATAIASGSYAVTVGTQPTGMYCQVTQGTGTVGSTNIDSVVVTCSSTTACSSPTNAVPPTSDPLWAIYSSPTDSAVDSTPEITTELANPFATCLAGSTP